MCGFAEFEISRGIAPYGKNFTEFARATGADNIEDLRLNNGRCEIANPSGHRPFYAEIGARRNRSRRRKELAARRFCIGTQYRARRSRPGLN